MILGGFTQQETAGVVAVVAVVVVAVVAVVVVAVVAAVVAVVAVVVVVVLVGVCILKSYNQQQANSPGEDEGAKRGGGSRTPRSALTVGIHMQNRRLTGGQVLLRIHAGCRLHGLHTGPGWHGIQVEQVCRSVPKTLPHSRRQRPEGLHTFRHNRLCASE